MIHSTSGCAQFNHPEIQVCVSNRAVPAADIAWFLQFLEQSVAAGEQFRAGETLQVGWMLTRIEETPDGRLRITEPDMRAVPILFVDSIDSTLTHLRNQKDVVESLLPAVDTDFPSLRQSAVVHLNYKTAHRLLLTRYPANGMESGWLLSDLDDREAQSDPTKFLRVSLYQFGVDRPDLIRFFAIPSGLQVAIDGFVGVLGADGELAQAPGSYLAELNRLWQQRSN